MLDDQILLPRLKERGCGYFLDAIFTPTSSACAGLADRKASRCGLVAREARIARLRSLGDRGLQHLLRLWGISWERQHILGHEAGNGKFALRCSIQWQTALLWDRASR